MRLLLALAALLLAAPAWAGLPVAYDADYKTVKKNVFIGDPLGQVGGRTGGLRPIRYNVSTPAGSLSLYPHSNATQWRGFQGGWARMAERSSLRRGHGTQRCRDGMGVGSHGARAG